MSRFLNANGPIATTFPTGFCAFSVSLVSSAKMMPDDVIFFFGKRICTKILAPNGTAPGSTTGKASRKSVESPTTCVSLIVLFLPLLLEGY